MRCYKVFLMKITVISVLVLCFLTIAVRAQENNEIQVYNRNEKVQLSKSIIQENDDYYISIDDLDKINIKYKFTELDNGFEFMLFSENSFGTENKLSISAYYQDVYSFGDNGNLILNRLYHFSNYMESKKTILLNSNGMQAVTRYIGNYASVIITDNDYYISFKAIAAAISYEYSVNDNIIKLWITDSNHHIINGEISLPDGEVAVEGGIKVNILVMDGGRELTNKYTLKNIFIPKGENKVYYYVETDILDKYNWLMFEFDGNYKTINELVNTSSGALLNVKTVSAEKIPFNVNIFMPWMMEADEEIYADIIFDNCAIYSSREPIIKKGEKRGTVTLNIDKDFSGKVAFANILGDNRLYPYGYYGYGDCFRLLGDNARIVYANKGEISTALMQCYEISGQVLPMDINSGYKVKVFAETNDNEKIYLTDDVGDDFKFNIKVPCSADEYTLSVAYKPGVYCRYVCDGVSTYSNKYHLFKNDCSYTEIKLKYEPFLPNLPIDMNVSIGKMESYVNLKNFSDGNLTNFNIFYAHYREGKLIYLSSIPIDSLMGNSDYKNYKFEYPKEFYKTDEVRVFVFDSNLKPLSISIAKKVNEPYYPDDMEFYDVNPVSQYYDAIKDIYIAGVCLGYEDGTFHPEEYVMRSEAAAMFCRLIGYWCNTYDFSCEDVPKTNWESSYVGICVNENIFELTNNTFRPYENITVNETYEAIKNLIREKGFEADRTALLMNIDTKDLERNITRAEFAQLLYNYKVFLRQKV